MKEFYKAHKKLMNLGFTILGIGSMFLIYHLVYLGVQNPYVFPSLKTIFSDFFNFLGQSSTYLAFGHTLARSLTALLISFILGFMFGLLSGLFEPFEKFFKPILSFMKCVPVPCFVFIIFIYLYSNIFLSASIVVFMVIFPIIYESMKEGVRNIDPNIAQSLRLEGFYRPKCITKVIIPMSFPYVGLSLLTSFGLAIKVEITAEILFNSNKTYGLGQLIKNSYYESEFSQLFALVLIVLIIFLLLDSIRWLLKDKLLSYKISK